MGRLRNLLVGGSLLLASVAAAQSPLPYLLHSGGKHAWVMSRRWNGDQTDYRLNLTGPALLTVRMGTYR